MNTKSVFLIFATAQARAQYVLEQRKRDAEIEQANEENAEMVENLKEESTRLGKVIESLQ